MCQKYKIIEKERKEKNEKKKEGGRGEKRRGKEGREGGKEVNRKGKVRKGYYLRLLLFCYISVPLISGFLNLFFQL
jgi:hypothetical protein